MPGAAMVSLAALPLDGGWDRPWLPDSTLTEPEEQPLNPRETLGSAELQEALRGHNSLQPGT